mmetsp:Transcript_27647/g.44198  ORF Transcript_27647/g.44198 Transcript_27647/m.44198 type:complete len:285 (+) Transcript_27647:48-902(+)
MSSLAVEQRNQEATVYVGNLDQKCTEDLVGELFVQCGPVEHVFLPRDKVTGTHYGYGFVEFKTEQDADYAMKVMNMVKLYGSPIKVNKSSSDREAVDIGANLFIGNLDDMVDEKLLHDTFSAFGRITQTPSIQRDAEIGKSKGFGFVSFDSFEASDLAIQCMNDEFLCNRKIKVEYSIKKGSTGGERHGSQAERLLARERKAKEDAARPAVTVSPFVVGSQPLAPHGMPAPPTMMMPPPPMHFAPPPLPPQGQMMMMMGAPPPLPPPPPMTASQFPPPPPPPNR